MVFDSSGDLWVANANGVSKFSGSGSAITSTANTSGGISDPLALAIDGLGQVWTANGNGTVSALSNNATAITPATGYGGAGLSTPGGIAVDLSGNLWVTNSSDNSVTEVLGVAAPTAPLSTAVTNGTTGVQP
jgi:ligand-binding sensor domain-containing protein